METTNNERKIQLTEAELERFINYVNDFYNEKTGIYKLINVDKELVKQAVEIYITNGNENIDQWGDGDSLDRENVRHILETRLGATYDQNQ